MIAAFAHPAWPWAATAALALAMALLGPWLVRRRRWLAVERRLDAALPRAAGARSFSSLSDLSALGSAPLVGFAAGIAAMLALVLGRADAALALALAGSAPGMVGRVLKRVSAIERPAADERDFAAPITFGSSFPSNHTLMATAFWITAALLLRDLVPAAAAVVGAAAVAIVLSVGIARIVLRAHFLVDVIGGWVLGAAFAWACVSLVR